MLGGAAREAGAAGEGAQPFRAGGGDGLAGGGGAHLGGEAENADDGVGGGGGAETREEIRDGGEFDGAAGERDEGGDRGLGAGAFRNAAAGAEGESEEHEKKWGCRFHRDSVL